MHKSKWHIDYGIEQKFVDIFIIAFEVRSRKMLDNELRVVPTNKEILGKTGRRISPSLTLYFNICVDTTILCRVIYSQCAEGMALAWFNKINNNEWAANAKVTLFDPPPPLSLPLSLSRCLSVVSLSYNGPLSLTPHPSTLSRIPSASAPKMALSI